MESFELLCSAHSPSRSCLQAAWRGGAAKGGCCREVGRAFCLYLVPRTRTLGRNLQTSEFAVAVLCEFNASRNCL